MSMYPTLSLVNDTSLFSLFVNTSLWTLLPPELPLNDTRFLSDDILCLVLLVSCTGLFTSAASNKSFCLLYSPKQKTVNFHAQKQIGKSHVIDIFASEDMENISLCIFQYFTLYYI